MLLRKKNNKKILAKSVLQKIMRNFLLWFIRILVKNKSLIFIARFICVLNKDWFSTYETICSGTVLVGNNTYCKIAGIRSVRIKMFDGVVRMHGDVRYVPDINCNRISLGTLDAKRYKYTGEGRILIVSKWALVVMKPFKNTTN